MRTRSRGGTNGCPVLVAVLLSIVVMSSACGDSGADTVEPSATSVEEKPAASIPPSTETVATTTTGPELESTTTPSTSTTTTAPATTTTTPAPVVDDGSDRIGYRVVGVAADDVLNVRADGSAQAPIVGELAPDATGVLVTDTRGDVWWRVLLNDGIVGWVNSTYLAVDEAWTAPFDLLPCAAGNVAWGEAQLSPQPVSPSDARLVWGYDYLESAECDRLVIRLARQSDDASLASWQVSHPAATVPGGVRVTSGSNRVIVTFPEDFFDIRLGMARVDYGSVELFAVAPTESPRKRAIELLYSSERIAHARFLDDPARIVVDILAAPDPTGIDYSPHAEHLWVLSEPALWDGSIPGTEQPLTITGMGRPYEAWGIANLRRIDGSAVEALWSGGINCTDDRDAATARGDTYCFYATYDVWGEFSITIDELTPGHYELSIADECAAGDDEVDCDALVLRHEFTVE